MLLLITVTLTKEFIEAIDVVFLQDRRNLCAGGVRSQIIFGLSVE